MASAGIPGLYEEGRKAWPDLAVDRDAFADFVRERVAEHGSERLRAPDLYLVCGCAAGEPRALALLDQHFIDALDPALARLDPSGGRGADVKQMLRLRFLTSEDGRPPRIADYSGVGDLRTWLRVAAVRMALDLQRKQRREVMPGDDDLVDLPAQQPDPELDLLKHTYREEFSQAFRSAIDSLTARERTLLRLQVLDQLSIDRIGAFYGIHRATAARWVARARDRLIKAVRRDLAQRLGVNRNDLDSILQLVRSQLDLSLRLFLPRS